MAKFISLLIRPESAVGFIFGIRAKTGMCMLKVVSSETDLGV